MTIDFLSSPIACVACERTELLKTEIGVTQNGSIFLMGKFSILYGMYTYTYGMYTDGTQTYSTYGMYTVLLTPIRPLVAYN